MFCGTPHWHSSVLTLKADVAPTGLFPPCFFLKPLEEYLHPPPRAVSPAEEPDLFCSPSPQTSWDPREPCCPSLPSAPPPSTHLPRPPGKLITQPPPRAKEGKLARKQTDKTQIIVHVGAAFSLLEALSFKKMLGRRHALETMKLLLGFQT